MSSTGKGRVLGFEYGDEALLPRPDLVYEAGPSILNDFFWGTDIIAPPTPVEIPVCWLSQPVQLRMNPPYTSAAITRTNGNVSRAYDASARAEFGKYEFAATLDSAIAGDPANLASWTITYRAQPRTAAPDLSINLLYRTDAERHKVLSVERGSRIRITGVPAEFPEGAADLVVTGIRHDFNTLKRTVGWTTDPVIGATFGEAGPWFYLDASVLDGTDAMPF